jgi:hypothetical protein
LIVAVRSGAGSEALAARIGRVGEACLRLQREADLRLLEIDLACW